MYFFLPPSNLKLTSLSIMATAPVKLHNFPLASLKWGSKNQVNHQRCRRPVDSPPAPHPLSQQSDCSNQPNNRRSPSSDGEHNSGGPSAESESRKLHVGYRTARTRITFIDRKQKQQLQLTPERQKEIEKEKAKGVDPNGEGCGVREINTVVGGDRAEVSSEADVDESSSAAAASKPWNLRPRRAVTKGIEIGNGGTGSSGCGASKNGEYNEQMENSLPKSTRLRGLAENGGGEKREKRKFWIALSRDEIEEDIYSMTGFKPSRKTKKRARAVQKQIDNLFPGQWLVGISPESYKGPDAPPKR